MEKNAKTILLAVFILLIAIISFNFTGMTGEAIKSKDILKVISPLGGVVHRGDSITIKITPTKEGVDNRYMYIHRENGARMQNSKAWVCGRYGNTCYESSEVVYNALGTYDKRIWPEGNYIVRVKNHKTGENIDTKFKLME